MAADFRHEQERMAWGRLERSGALRAVVDTYQEISNDFSQFSALKGRNFLVTQETYPGLYRLHRMAAERVGVETEVPLYLEMEYTLRTRTVGTDGDCAIVLNSACLEECSDAQLLALLGHELAHIRYGHIRMLHIHEMTDRLLGLIPLAGRAAAEGFKATLLQWRKYADMTADRGAAIAAGSADAAAHNLSQSMGRKLDKAGMDATLDALPAEKEMKLGVVGTAVFQIMTGSIPVPYGVWRMKELKTWCGSPACRENFPAVYYGTQSEFGLEGMTDGDALYRQYRVMQEENRERGLALLHAAANCGNGPAQAELGRRYLQGDGLTANLHEGLTLARGAALAGVPEGCYQLAECFARGWEGLLRRDEKRAAWLYRVAAAAGHREAAEKAKGKVHVLSPRSMESLLNWLVTNYSGGSAILNEMNPVDGLDEDCCPGIGAVRNFLWIPLNERVYLAEFGMNGDGTIAGAIAVGATGIYVFDGKGLPTHLSWPQWAEAKVDALQTEELVTLRLNGKALCSYPRKTKERAVGVFLVKLRSVLSRKNG